MSTTKTTTLGPLRIRFERCPYPDPHPAASSWMLTVQLGKGAGYRWLTLPGYSHNVAHRIRRRMYVPGVTAKLARRPKVRGAGADIHRVAYPAWAAAASTDGNALHIYPGWWI